MTTAAQAYAIIKSRLTNSPPTVSGGGAAVALRWQGLDEGALPDKPAPFIYTEFLADPAELSAFGGGRGANLYRNPAQVIAYVFVPAGWGLNEALLIGEQIAALFRSYRDASLSCFDASVIPGGHGSDLKPPGVRSEVDAYFYSTVTVSLFYDQVG